MRNKKLPYAIFILFFTFVLHFCTTGQSTNGLPATGSLKGAVWDSVLNHALQDATVAVYNAADSSLVQFRVTDVYGGFRFDRLPVNTPLYALITYAGFELLARDFILRKSNEELNLGKLVIRKTTQTLKEVIISSVIPVRVNKDTIEFNARAFNLDSNAVVEDLVRQLPGMTVWSDGAITLNGREIKSLTVNGKPFLGQSFKVATQNIPKVAVDKIQVFNQVSMEDPLDTLTSMNIKLLKGKELGYFGKIGIGRGTDNRFQLDGMFNVFNGKNQLSVGGASNNVNKLANNMTTLLEHSAFKSVAATVDYQPNFRQEGIDKSYVGGVTYKRNLSDRIDYTHNNAIKFDYFNRHQAIEANEQRNTLVYLNNDTRLVQDKSRRSEQVLDQHDVTANYNFLETSRELDVAPFLSMGSSRTNVAVAENSSENGIAQSTNEAFTSSKNTSEKYGLKVAYRNFNNYDGMDKRNFRDFKVAYAFIKGKEREDKSVVTNFHSTVTQSKTAINRTYRNDDDENAQQLDFELDNLNRLLFGGRSLTYFSLKLMEKAKLSEYNSLAEVMDYDSTVKVYRPNDYLSNQSTNSIFQNDLSLVAGKQLFYRNLSGRYRKVLSLTFEALGQYFQQNNKSEKAFQNINRSYFKPLPQLSLVFDHSKYSYIRKILSAKYTTAATYPTIDQMAPLLDSANVWLFNLGNPNLLPAIDKQIKLSFAKSVDQKQSYRYQIEIVGGEVKNMMADSTIYDVSGRAAHYIVNSQGYRYVGGSGTFRHATKVRFHQFQTSLSVAARYARTPGYVNKILLYTGIFTSGNTLSVSYTYKDNLALNLIQELNLYSAVQRFGGSRFSNSVYNSSLAITKNLNRRLSFSTDVTYVLRTTTNTRATNFLIWNAHLTGRLLRKNNMEVKCSAMDLLKQNSGLINEGTATTVTTGNTNVLRQYFMLTLSYFPRRFGK